MWGDCKSVVPYGMDLAMLCRKMQSCAGAPVKVGVPPLATGLLDLSEVLQVAHPQGIDVLQSCRGMAGEVLLQGMRLCAAGESAVYLEEAVLVRRGLAVLDARPCEATQALQCR